MTFWLPWLCVPPVFVVTPSPRHSRSEGSCGRFDFSVGLISQALISQALISQALISQALISQIVVVVPAAAAERRVPAEHRTPSFC